MDTEDITSMLKKFQALRLPDIHLLHIYVLACLSHHTDITDNHILRKIDDIFVSPFLKGTHYQMAVEDSSPLQPFDE